MYISIQQLSVTRLYKPHDPSDPNKLSVYHLSVIFKLSKILLSAYRYLK